MSLSQLTGEGGRTQKRRYQKTICVIPKYSFMQSHCPKQVTLSAKKRKSWGKNFQNLQKTQGFSPDPALNTICITITQLEQYRSRLGKVSLKFNVFKA